jgi:multidrug efflux pump subunit AcrB
VRTVGEILEARQLEDVIVRSDPDGNLLTLSQVARIRDVFEEPVTFGRFNGQPAMNLLQNMRRDFHQGSIWMYSTIFPSISRTG